MRSKPIVVALTLASAGCPKAEQAAPEAPSRTDEQLVAELTPEQRLFCADNYPLSVVIKFKDGKPVEPKPPTDDRALDERCEAFRRQRLESLRNKGANVRPVSPESLKKD